MAEGVPITLELPIGELKSRAAQRRRATMLAAAPQIQAHYATLRKMSRRGLDDMSEADAEQVLTFYNSVVADGRYVKLLRTEPAKAAEKLGLEVRPEVLDSLVRVSDRVGGDVQGPVEAVIAVAVVIVLAPKIPALEDGVVIDEMATVRARL